MSTLSESKVHRFNLNTLRLDKELETLKFDLLLMPGEIQKRAVVAAQWHTAMDKQVCPLCASMQGNIIPVDSPEWGRVFPSLHLGCRCMLSYITADERGIVQRLEKYKPVDPDLLAKWSSKIYTDAEIREMVKQQKKLAPKWKEAESLDEAKEFAQDNIVKTGGAVDYGELSLESTNLLNQETYALTQTYRVKPDFLGSTQGWNRWVDKIGIYKPYKAPPVPDHIFAQMRAVSISGRRPSHIGLTLNEKYWSVAGRRNFDERLKEVIQQGWFKDGSISVQKASLIRHEYGHVLDIDGKMSKGLGEDIWKAIGIESSLKEHLGGYAAADGEREMWAELFAGYEGHRLSPTLMRLVGRRLP